MHSACTRSSPRLQGAVLVTLACCLLLTVGGPAGAAPAPPRGAPPAKPGPSAEEVARAREDARTRAKELGTVAARLAAAEAALAEVTAEAERLVEAYNGEMVRLAQAEAAHRAALDRTRSADAQVDEAGRAVAALAARTYGAIDLTSPTAALLAGQGGLPGFLYRASMVQHIGAARSETVNRLRDAQQVFAILRKQAERAYVEQSAAADRARAAKERAEAAVARQVAETRRLEREKRELHQQADAARSTAERLARERAAARERRRLARLARQVQAISARPAQGGAGGKATTAWARRSASVVNRGHIAANWAMTQLGKPYVWAADGPNSYDCSGLTMRAWEKVGVRLDHWTGTQWTSGPRVPLKELQRGDLLFFGKITANPGDIHHVGIYIGQGMMVHAPRTGDVVRVASIWRGDLVGAVRPAGRTA